MTEIASNYSLFENTEMDFLGSVSLLRLLFSNNKMLCTCFQNTIKKWITPKRTHAKTKSEIKSEDKLYFTHSVSVWCDDERARTWISVYLLLVYFQRIWIPTTMSIHLIDIINNIKLSIFIVHSLEIMNICINTEQQRIIKIMMQVSNFESNW